MIVDIEKIKEDIDTLKLMDVDAEVEKKLGEIRAAIEAERDAHVAKLEALLEMIDNYEVVEEDEEEIDDEAEVDDADEECENIDEVDNNATDDDENAIEE